MKSILMILNYFYPDIASTAQLFTELCDNIKDDFNITVICTVPNYTGLEDISSYKKINYDNYKNIKVIRIKLDNVNKMSKLSRIKYITGYFINAFKLAINMEKTDLVFSISQPPILGGLLGALVKLIKKNKFIYCIEDFNPEQIIAVGYSKNKYLLSLAKFIDNMSCKYADKVILVGHDMQRTLFKRLKYFNKSKSIVINNWINEENIYPISKDNFKVKNFLKQNGLEDKFVIMYSGNLGLYYDLENLIKLFGKFKEEKDIVFMFIGEGAIKSKLKSYVIDNNIENIKFLSYQPKEQLIYSLNAADLHLVTNAKGIKGVSVPSKIYGVMAVGKPILGILEKGSEARLLIRLSKCGVVVEPERYELIEKNIKYIINNKEKIKSMGINGRNFLETNLSMKKSIEKYRDLFKKI